jgi:hypothetical protein
MSTNLEAKFSDQLADFLCQADLSSSSFRITDAKSTFLFVILQIQSLGERKIHFELKTNLQIDFR